MILRLLFVVLLSLTLFSCALPAPAREEQSFIPVSELRVIELTNEAISYYRKSRYVDAEFRFRQALLLAPGTANIMLNLALTLEQSGQFEEALDLIGQLLKKAPGTLKYRFAKAHIYLSQEDYERSVREYLAIFHAAVDKENALFAASAARSLATIKFQIAEEEQARCYSENALFFDGSTPQRIRHAKVLLGTSQYDELLSAYQIMDLLQLGTTNADLLAELAFATFATGEIEKSKLLSMRAKQLKFVDPSIGSDLKILDAVLKKLYPDEEEEELDEDEREEAEQTLKDMFEVDHLENPSAIYWPEPFLVAIRSIQEELFPDGLSG